MLFDRALRPPERPIPMDPHAQPAGSISISSKEFPEIDPRGKKECSAALAAALATVPEGWEAVIAPGSYRVSNPINGERADLILSGHGVTLIQDGASPVISATTSWGDPIVVNTLSSSAASTRLELESGVTWSPGTLVKIISDDPIPGARTAVGNRVARSGEFAVVASTEGTTVTLVSTVREKYTRNVRVLEVSRRTTVVRGFTLETASSAAAVVGAPMIFLSGAFAPLVEDVRCKSAVGPVVHLNSCFGFTVNRLDVSFAADHAPHQLGYGVLDNCSEFGSVLNSTVRFARHAYTDDSPPLGPGSQNPHRYGRSYANSITDCRAVAPSEAGFSTHHASEATRFSGCVVSSGGPTVAGFALRGRNHLVDGGAALRVGIAVRAFTESSRGGESFGHTVVGLVARDIADAAVALDVNPKGHPLAGQRETRTVLTAVGLVTDAGVSAIRATNATTEVSASHVDLLPTGDGAALIRTDNSSVVVRDTELSASTSSAWSPITAADSASSSPSRTEFHNVTLDVSASAAAAAGSVVHGSAHEIVFESVTLGSSFPELLGALLPTSQLSWRCRPSDDNTPAATSAGQRLTGDVSSAISGVWTSTDPHLFLECNSPGRRQSIQLQPPRMAYQTVTLLCTGQGAEIDLQDAGNAPIVLRSGTSRVLVENSSVTLVWATDRWVQG
ncbi:hypothetical protein ACF044_18415 [Microbacterium sp. NPDC016588]